jgi:hypothetical protein
VLLSTAASIELLSISKDINRVLRASINSSLSLVLLLAYLLDIDCNTVRSGLDLKNIETRLD